MCVDVKFFRADVNFQTAIVIQFHYRFFHFDINQHQGPTNTSYKISAKIYQAVLEKMAILIVLLFLVMAAILNSRPV